VWMLTETIITVRQHAQMGKWSWNYEIEIKCDDLA
jgi:hypothetical protein